MYALMEVHYWYVMVIFRSVHETTQVLNTLQTRCIVVRILGSI